MVIYHAYRLFASLYCSLCLLFRSSLLYKFQNFARAAPMEKTETPKRTFVISFAEQVNDGLVTSEDLLGYLRDKMKVKKSKELANKVIEYEDRATEIELTTEKTNLFKKDLKLYLKRYLRAKDLKNFIKVAADSIDSLKFEYINKVDELE